MDYMGSILAMVICIAMSAYFSATETAFSSLNKTRLKVLADNGNRRAALTLKLAGNYDKLISTILIGNNIVNILVAWRRMRRNALPWSVPPLSACGFGC